MLRNVLICSVLSLVPFLQGCGGSSGPKAPPTGMVSGTVNLDGKPMESGEISFILPGEAPAAIPVKAGKFEGKAAIGENRVEIRSFRPGQPVMMGDKPVGEPVPQNFLPSKYNVETQFKEKIEAAGKKDLKFEVTSQ